ncbi:hypothetical protein ACSBR1_038518 [Camellia fascicularis]
MCHQTLMNQLVSLWSIFSWSSRQNWLDYNQLKYARNQSKRPSVKIGFLGLWGKSAMQLIFIRMRSRDYQKKFEDFDC